MNFTVQTEQSQQVVDITDRVNTVVSDADIETGQCTVFVMHTTAAITTADLDPGTDLDMLDAFYEMIPNLDYRHPHDPEHVPDHILATLIGPSLTAIIQDGVIMLGTWQRIVLFEFNGPRERQICVTIQSHDEK